MLLFWSAEVLREERAPVSVLSVRQNSEKGELFALEDALVCFMPKRQTEGVWLKLLRWLFEPFFGGLADAMVPIPGFITCSIISYPHFKIIQIHRKRWDEWLDGEITKGSNHCNIQLAFRI